MSRRYRAADPPNDVFRPRPQLSPECQHLIHHMFRPNPEERCTIEDIMRHPWFVKDMPPQLAHINSYLLHAKVCPNPGPLLACLPVSRL